LLLLLKKRPMQLNKAQLETLRAPTQPAAIGAAGQKQLLLRACCWSARGLGSAAGFYLCAAGIGTLGILDSDRVTHNLHAQIWHFTRDIGRSKVMCRRRKLRDLNPDVAIQTYRARLEADKRARAHSPYDLWWMPPDISPRDRFWPPPATPYTNTYVHGAVCEFPAKS
jgi:molybdopterin/thiamine biosynthesis adenylyltransferase